MRTKVQTLATVIAAGALLSACATTTGDGTDSTGTGDGTESTSRPAPERPSAAAEAPGSGAISRAVVAAGDAFLRSLSAEQREQAVYDVGDPALREWFYFPTADDRNGVALGDLDDEQRAAALDVAEAVLSDDGYTQMRGVLAAEDALGVLNNDPTANSGRYFFAFFGEPSPTERFTVQINGHHLAVNHTYADGRVSPTPAFTGVDPVDFEVAGERTRPLLAKSSAVSGLLDSMDEGQLAAARIDPTDDVRVGTGATETYPQPEGTLARDLSQEQRALVMTAVRAWVGDTDERTAARLEEQYRAQLDRTRIAWSGSPDPDTPGAYLRIDGPRLWIEFSNVGRFGNGQNHYHSVFRDKQTDYLG